MFFRAVVPAMRSDRHFWATLNYVHHGYLARWTDWPWSSAPEYLAQTDPDEAKRIWHEYPLDDYGKGWDDPEMLGDSDECLEFRVYAARDRLKLLSDCQLGDSVPCSMQNNRLS